MKTSKLAKSYRIDNGKHFRLKDFNPADTGHWKSIDEAKEHVQKDIDRMRKLQDMLYAQDCWSLLLIFQALDAAGKDGTSRRVSKCSMTSCGALRETCPSAATSESSTAPIMKRC